jgi:hypothetical protein
MPFAEYETGTFNPAGYAVQTKRFWYTGKETERVLSIPADEPRDKEWISMKLSVAHSRAGKKKCQQSLPSGLLMPVRKYVGWKYYYCYYYYYYYYYSTACCNTYCNRRKQ